MSYEKGNAEADANSMKSVATAPLALAGLLILFFGVTAFADDVMIDIGKLVVLPVAAAIAAALGRIGTIATPNKSLVYSLAFIAVAIVMDILSLIEPMVITTFVFMGISTITLVQANRNEEATILLSIVVGFHLAVSYAAGMPELTLAEDASLQGHQLIDIQRAGIGANFFAFWVASVVIGTIFAVFFRGTIDNPGKGSLFASIPSSNWNPDHLRQFIVTSVVLLIVNLIPLIWLSGITEADVFESHHYLGSVWALATSIIVLFVSFCRTERWHVIGSLVAVNWLIYTVAHLVEIGNDLPSTIGFLSANDTASTWTWFGLTFWLNVGAALVASRGYFGDISPRREPSAFRLWWQTNSYSILVGSALVVAFVVRTGWNVLPSMNANITGLWDMTGGSDPWYMKRVVDYIVAERAHFIFDADRAYPVGGINPRPPLFSWCLALGGIALEWLTGTPADETVWWSVAALPAVFGALIILPISGIANRLHSAQAGIIAAWLMALMPGHISHSTFGLADHDSFALLFLTLAFYFWVKAVEHISSEKLFLNPSTNPLYLVAGIREMWRRNPTVMANATLAGISFSTVALGWKGFVYGPGILFLAFAVQVLINLFRRRDSLPLTAASLQMILTTFIIPLPFYIWPGMNLLLAPSGFQPMFYIVGFTFALGWVACSFRDKPWLLVLGSGAVLFGAILSLLWILQEAEIYDGWDILFTGGFYFSKNKIFGTIGEAQAPSRGVLFASYGPIVALIAVGYSFVLLWRGAKDERQDKSLLGLWVLIATYMAWTAGRFIFNATPAIAVAGAVGIAALWKGADFSGFVKEWRRSGIGTPRTRFSSVRVASRRRPMIPVLLLVFMLVASQHITYGIDSGIPRGEPASGDVDQTIYDITPDILRFEVLGLSLLDDTSYNPSSTCGSGCWYMGTFGPGFNGGGWNMAYEWLSEQDSDTSFGNKPAFVSWWDYGFQALESGSHPTVADNFQSGIPQSGAMLLSSGEEHTLALFISTLAQGDKQYESDSDFTQDFKDAMDRHMTHPQQIEFTSIMALGSGQSQFVLDRSLALVAEDGGVELLSGSKLDSNGLPMEKAWYVHQDGEQVGNSTLDASVASALFNQTRSNSQNYDDKISHYIMGDYRYTKDLIDDFDDVSTNLHRVNSKLGLARAFLTTAFTTDELVDFYHDLSTSVEYEVQDYESSIGQTITRNNEIRYFAIDDRLYPLGGRYYEDSSYHRGQTTGIFYAPTTLSGLDPDNYIDSVYWAQRAGQTPQPYSAAEYEEAYLNDVVAQQSGAMTDPSMMINLVDIQYVQTEDFFETMVARIYVGYGTSSLGLSGDPAQPGPTWAISGTPNSYLENAFPLPGAMMNHFVIANWYNDGTDSPDSDNNSVPDIFDGGYAAIGRAHTNVKIVKYYSGATIEGTVEVDGLGPVPNARILIERDAFSGEEVADENGDVIDRDQRTYWIPIGTTDADENGHYSFTAPAGRIRVSAFFGEPDIEGARIQLSSGVGGMLQDIATESYSTERNVNLITGILGNVSGSQWLSETIVNISAEDGHSNGAAHVMADISVAPSFATGRLSWNGDEKFDDNAITNAVVELTPSWDAISLDPITLETSTGSVSGANLSFQGIGEVTFTGAGQVISTGIVTVEDFVGTHRQTITHAHSLAGDGEFSGRGTLSGTIDSTDIVDGDCNENGTMPENFSICSLSDGDYLIDGIVNATGRFTSNGTSSFIQMLNGSSLSGTGVFTVDASDESISSYGIINGTGTFSGEGYFSGAMVKEGTFHMTDAIPGEYDVTVVFEDGTRIEITDGFSVPFAGTASLHEIDLAGGLITGSLVDVGGEPITESVTLYNFNETDMLPSGECSEVQFAPCTITANETGMLSFGPVVPGEYTVSIDMDGDGFNEAEVNHIFDSDIGDTIEFPSPIPDVHDLTFTLTRTDNGTEVSVDELNLTMISADGTNADTDVLYDSDSNHYYVELIDGDWVLSHTLSDSEQLWEQIMIDSDQSHEFAFHESTMVTGLVLYDTRAEPSEEEIAELPIEHVPVEFNWNGFSTTATTNGQGIFNVVLPVGAIVDATVQAGTMNVVDGIRFTVSEDMDNLTMIARPGSEVTGAININRLGNYYSSDLIGWEAVTVYASNETFDADWTIDVREDGSFDTVLPQGNWTFTTNLEWLNTTDAILEVDGKDDTVNVYAYPADSFAEIDFFIDNSADNNVSNGTAVQYRFSIIPLNVAGETTNVSSTGDEWSSLGHASVPVEAGSYRIDVEISDARAGDLFGTRILTGNAYFDVGFGGETVTRSIGYDPEWKIDLTFTNESGGALVDQNVKFINTDTGWIMSRLTDSNGTLIDHLPEGQWIAVINSLTTGEGVEEGHRSLLEVSESNAGVTHELSTSELAMFTVEILDEGGEPIEGLDVILTSNEGLGKVHLDFTDTSGQSEGSLVAGSWNIEINETMDRTRYLIESSELAQGGLQSGPNGQINLTVLTYVEMSGTIFWDHDDDDDADVGEGVSGVSILMTSDGLENISLDTDGAGEWNVFVPIDSVWNVTANRIGFSQEYEAVSMSNANSIEIELTAGTVTISGNITFSQFDDISSDIELVLIPDQGMVRERVTPTKVLDDGVWNGSWTASVEPGRWILRATVADSNLVGMTVVDADISEGGSADTELNFGGWLYLSSQWLDYEGDSHNLADMSVIDPEFTISIGAEIEWDALFDEEGGISLLLPSVTIELSGEFTVDQMDRTMEYNAGKNINIPTSGTDVTASVSQELAFTRIANHEVDSNTTAMQGGNATDGDLSDVQILSVNEEYTAVEYTVVVDYLGHEPLSTYSVVGNVPGTDGQYWNVSFYNDTGEVWQNQYSFDMGLDGDNTTLELRVRVEAANWTTARALDEGHTVSIKFSSVGGFTHSHDLVLRVPQHHGFELTEEMLEVYGVRAGQELSIPILFTNSGNGDERYEFEFDDIQLPENWERTGATSHTIGGFTSTTHTMKVIAPENATGDEEFTITVSVTDKAGVSYPAIPILIKSSAPVLKINDVISQSGSDPTFGSAHTFIVIVENTGLVDAKYVIVNATVRGQNISTNQTMDVLAGQEVEFFVNVDFTSLSAGQIEMDFTLEGEDVGENPDSEYKRITLRTPSIDDSTATGALMWVLLVMLLIAGWYLTKGGSRRPGAPF